MRSVCLGGGDVEDPGISEPSEVDEIVLDEPWREQVQRRMIIMSVALATAILFVMAAQVIR